MNKYQSKLSTQAQKNYIDYLIDPRFQGLNRVFVLSFENSIKEDTQDIIFQNYDGWKKYFWLTNQK